MINCCVALINRLQSCLLQPSDRDYSEAVMGAAGFSRPACWKLSPGNAFHHSAAPFSGIGTTHLWVSQKGTCFLLLTIPVLSLPACGFSGRPCPVFLPAPLPPAAVSAPLAPYPQLTALGPHPGSPTESIFITLQPCICYSCSARVGFPKSLQQCRLWDLQDSIWIKPLWSDTLPGSMPQQAPAFTSQTFRWNGCFHALCLIQSLYAFQFFLCSLNLRWKMELRALLL